jgi:serine/threonine protein kinase
MDTALQAGDVLQGRYEIRRPLRAAPGKTVYLAHDRDLDCEVALDVFSDNAAIMPGGLPVHAWEAKVLGRLGDHPNIATVLNHWDDGDTAVMVTRYLPGGSLCDLVARAKDSGGDLPVPDILRISLEIAHGLAHIHKRRILYLDLQPRNVLFDEWGTVRLVDFDTAVLVDQAQRIDLSDRPGVEYLAPELTDGKDPDERSDLYSLGATIYEMAAGHAPFTGTPEEILAARRAAPPSPERTDLPGALRDLILSLLALQPDHRPASAAEVGKRLDDLRTAREEIEWLLASDESARLEFKSSLRVPRRRAARRRPRNSSETLNSKFLKRWRHSSTPTAARSSSAWPTTERLWASRSTSRASGNHVMAGARRSTTSSPVILAPKS